MTLSPLDNLTQTEFQESVGVVLPPRAFRRALLNNQFVRRLATAIRLGQISEQSVREFASSQAAQYQPGKVLPGDVALAALAVALESYPPDFAEEYLCDLARLQLTELATPIHVARECLKSRFSLPKNEVRTFTYPAPRVSPRRSLIGVPYLPRMRRRLPVTRYLATESANATS